MLTEVIGNALPDSDPNAAILKVLSDPELLTLFGGPKASLTPPKEDADYSRWFIALWGRRCATYLGEFERGITFARKHGLITIADEHVEKIEHLSSLLYSNYRKLLQGDWSIARSLHERMDIANFHITYLDPVLFSALYQYEKHNSRLNDTDRNVLLDMIDNEMRKCCDIDQARFKSAVIDESTAWWGLTNAFSRLIDTNTVSWLKNLDEAVILCDNLLRPDPSPRFPSGDAPLLEATYEIYSELRTNLMIIRNCLTIWGLLKQYPHHRQRLNEPMSLFVKTLYERCHYAPEITNHVYFTGLGLGVATSLVEQSYEEDSCFVVKKGVSDSRPSMPIRTDYETIVKECNDRDAPDIVIDERAKKVLFPKANLREKALPGPSMATIMLWLVLTHVGVPIEGNDFAQQTKSRELPKGGGDRHYALEFRKLLADPQLAGKMLPERNGQCYVPGREFSFTWIRESHSEWGSQLIHSQNRTRD